MGTSDVGAEIFRLLRAHGFSPAQAAGVVGNTQQESGNNPRDAGGGLFQGIGGRARLARGDAVQQVRTALSEEPGAWAALRRARTPEEAARIFSQQFERPGIPKLEHRERYAAEALQRYGHLAPGEPAGEGEGGATTTTTRSPAGTSPAQLATLMALMDAGNAPNPAQDVSAVTLRKPGEQGLHTPAPAAEPPGRDLNSLLSLIDQIGEQGEAPRTETTTEGGEGGGGGGGGGGGAYVNPLPGFKKGRVDQGVDYSGRPGMAIRAMGNGRVLGVSPDWYAGQPYVYYELTDGPQRGKVVYVAEQIAPRVRAGEHVRAGQTIGTYASHGTALETGYGTHTGGRVEDPYNGRPDGTETAAGLRYKRVLEGLGAR